MAADVNCAQKEISALKESISRFYNIFHVDLYVGKFRRNQVVGTKIQVGPLHYGLIQQPTKDIYVPKKVAELWEVTIGLQYDGEQQYEACAFSKAA